MGPTTAAFVKRRHKLLIDGERIEHESGQNLPVYDPGTGESGWGRECGYHAIETFTEVKSIVVPL